MPSYAWVCYLAGWSEPVSCERIVKPACYVMEERKTKGCYKDLLLSYTQNKLNCIVFYIRLSFIMCIGIMVINVIYKADFFFYFTFILFVNFEVINENLFFIIIYLSIWIGSYNQGLTIVTSGFLQVSVIRDNLGILNRTLYWSLNCFHFTFHAEGRLTHVS